MAWIKIALVKHLRKRFDFTICLNVATSGTSTILHCNEPAENSTPDQLIRSTEKTT